MSDEIEDIKAELQKSRVENRPRLQTKDLLSCGSTVLNLACSGKAKGAFYKGKYYWLVGDSDSGKSFLSMTSFAQASINPEFAGYRFIHDNAEEGVLMDVEKFFGAEVNRRIEPPAGTRKEPRYSSTIEEFYFNLDDAFDKGVPFIYVLDSMDAIESDADKKKFAEDKAAFKKGKPQKGSYEMSKAKRNSSGMRQMFARLRKSKSIVIVISQTRDNIDQFSLDKKTVGGGRALKFYARLQLWTSPAGPITKKVGEKTREMGTKVKVKVRKNHQTGRKSEVTVPIYWSYGIDDIGGCIDYLVDEGHWKKDGGINAKEFGVKLNREKLVAHVEANALEGELRGLVADVWREIEEALTIKRKNPYK